MLGQAYILAFALLGLSIMKLAHAELKSEHRFAPREYTSYPEVNFYDLIDKGIHCPIPEGCPTNADGTLQGTHE